MLRLRLPAPSSDARATGSATIARERLAATLSAERRRRADLEAAHLLTRLLAEAAPDPGSAVHALPQGGRL